MRRFAIGSMVRQEMFKPHFEDKAIFRYGIIIEEISMEDMPYQKGLYFKILWQPSDSYAVSSRWREIGIGQWTKASTSKKLKCKRAI